ncbi:putative spermidine/putrescine transport system permease protein [Bradyrhizobium diazoefficiens]
MSSATPQRPNGLALFILPSALLFALFFFLPIGLMALMSVLTGNPVVAPKVAFTTRHYARMIDDPFYLEVIWTTIRIGLVTTLVALAIGYPLAHWMARIKSRTGHALLLMAVLAPMLTGIVVRTFAWMTLLSDKGVVNQTLMSLGVISQPLKLMYTETGIVVGLVHIYVPFMVLTLTGVIGRIDERLEQAAENLGASPLRAFLEVTLPLSLPGILAGSLLVFCAGDQRLCHADPARRLPDHDAADPDLPADLGELQRRLRRRARHHPADDLARARRRL